MAFKIGNNYFTASEQGGQIQRTTERDLLGRAGTGGSITDLINVDPSRIQVVPQWTLRTSPGRPDYEATLADWKAQGSPYLATYNGQQLGLVYNKAQAQAIGISSENYVDSGTIDTDQTFNDYLKSTGQTYSNGQFSGVQTLGNISDLGTTGGYYKVQIPGTGPDGKPLYDVYGPQGKLNIDQFHAAGLNIDHLPIGQTGSGSVNGGQVGAMPSYDEQLANLKSLGLSDATIQALGPQGVSQFASIGEAIKKMYESNYPVPQTFSQSDLDKILAQAQNDPNINQYYKDQLRVGQEELKRNLAYVQGDYQALEKQQQDKLLQGGKNLAEEYASKGAINSGFYEQAKTRLAEENQGIIESSKRTLQRELDQLGMGQEKTYGTSNLQPVSIGGVSYNPLTGIAGQLEQNRLLDIRGKEEELINKESLTRGLTK